MKKSFLSIVALCALVLTFASCEKNKEEKAFAMKFAEAINQKDTARIDSMMGTKGVFTWGETQIATVNLDSLKLEETGEHQYKVTLGDGKSFSMAGSMTDTKSFHITQPKNLFTCDKTLREALVKRGEIAADADDAAISAKIKEAKEKAVKATGLTFVAQNGLNYFFLKKRIASDDNWCLGNYENGLYKYDLISGQTTQISLRANSTGAGYLDFAAVGNKLFLINGIDEELLWGNERIYVFDTFYVDLETLKTKEVKDAVGIELKFSKDKKALTVTDLNDYVGFSTGMGDTGTHTKKIKLADIK